tara:strand:- start:237 stop:398 length:162 start_codon:yes stop_codon:yes gene_type:complete
MIAAFFLAVSVISLALLPAVALLWLWDNETPTLKRELNKRVGNGEKISRHNTI